MKPTLPDPSCVASRCRKASLWASPVSAIALVTALLAVGSSGCSQSSGPTLYRVTGKVSYGGVPVLEGVVLFTPDGSKRNSGRQAIAPIKDGQFDTRGSRAPGIQGGPMVVIVTGRLDPAKDQYFQHTFTTEMAREAATVIDIAVDPREAPAFTAKTDL